MCNKTSVTYMYVFNILIEILMQSFVSFKENVFNENNAHHRKNINFYYSAL